MMTIMKPDGLSRVKFIVHHAAPGIGDSFITLCAAYDYAVEYGVPLIIDWRNSRWVSHQNKTRNPKEMFNFFESLFNNRNIWGSATIITNPVIIDGLIPSENLSDLYGAETPLSGEIKKRFEDGGEAILPRNYDFSNLIKNYRVNLIKELAFSSRYLSLVTDFLHKYRYDSKKTIAVHIRLGNSEYVQICRKDISGVAQKLYQQVCKIGDLSPTEYQIFVATDTPRLLKAIKKKFKKYNVFEYDKPFPNTINTAGHLYVNKETNNQVVSTILDRTITDLILLSKSDYLISISIPRPFVSGFIYYARSFVSSKNTYFLEWALIDKNRVSLSRKIGRYVGIVGNFLKEKLPLLYKLLKPFF